MGSYQYALRNELTAYRQEIEKWSSPDLGKMTVFSQALFEKYLTQNEEGSEARGNFYISLYRINEEYYQHHVIAARSTKTKLLNFFGGRSKDETDFIKLQHNLKAMADKAFTASQLSWQEDAVFRGQLYIRKGNPRNYLHGMDDAENHAMRLRVYSHRLMRDKDFKGKEFGHFHGQSLELSAYKLQRDIKRYYGRYASELSAQQKLNLSECMHAIDGFLEIQEWLVFSRHLSLNNYLEANGQPNQNYDSRYNDICYRVYNKLHRLPPGKRLLTPHGYLDNNEGGHAALVEFERMKNGAFKISFINTGSGVNTQKRTFWNDLKLTFFGILNVTYVENISFETLVDKDLIKKIFDPVVYPRMDNEDAVAAMNDAINCFADELKHTDHVINLQLNGTCSFSCWLEWLGWRLDQGLFKSLDLFSNDRALQKLQRFYANNNVPLNLKNGIPALVEAGNDLVAKNRRDFTSWLDQNRENENWSPLRAIAKTMGVEVKDASLSFAKKLHADSLATQRIIEDYWGDEEAAVAPDAVKQQTSALGMFGKVAVGVAVAAAAVTLYSRLM